MRRSLTIVVLVTAVLVVSAGMFSFVTVRASFPDTSGEISVPGLHGEVEVKRDAHGIPQIYASDQRDLFFAQGFVHAQDRFWEMDFRRHVTAGRLAELVGEGAVETDKFVRTLGWRRVAEREYELLDEPTRELLRAYAAGVNSYLEDRSAGDLSLEYSVLSITGPDYRPEPWRPADSIAWIKAMSWDLRSNMDDELDRAILSSALPAGQVEELYPPDPAAHEPIVDRGATELRSGVAGSPAGAPGRRRATPPDALGPDALGPDALGPDAVAAMDAAGVAGGLRAVGAAAEDLPALLGTGNGLGSNSWVVAGDRSTSGEPILANDPHLAPSMPGVWYQNGLHCVEVSERCPYEVSGFSFTGMPGVVIGHNRRVAWGVTTMYADVTDLYLERIEGDTYEFRGRRLPVQSRKETIEVAGGESETITVRSTRHGPIVSDLDDELSSGLDELARGGAPDAAGGPNVEVALRWTASTPRPTVSAIFALGRMRNWADFQAAAELFTVPSQNLLYADVDGNIGYQSPGAIPIRTRGDGRYPVPGWTGEYEWSGTVPFDQLPRVLNPEQGYLVTANNQVAGDRYPVLLGEDTADGYRAERIRTLIEDAGPLDVEAMTRLQLDTAHPMAERLVPALLEVPATDDYLREARTLLADWDQRMEPDSPGAAYFGVLWRNLLALTFHDELPRDQWPDGGERWFTVVADILDKPLSHWWDDVKTPGRIETRDEVLAEVVQQSRDELTQARSVDPRKWAWSDLHELELVHPTLGESGVSVVEGLFNRGPVGLGGGPGIVNATSWHAPDGYAVTAVPSMRMVVDLADLDRSRWIQLSGNSGHAFHDHYDDQFERWSRGGTLPWSFSADAVDASTEDTLLLRPSVE